MMWLSGFLLRLALVSPTNRCAGPFWNSYENEEETRRWMDAGPGMFSVLPTGIRMLSGRQDRCYACLVTDTLSLHML